MEERRGVVHARRSRCVHIRLDRYYRCVSFPYPRLPGGDSIFIFGFHHVSTTTFPSKANCVSDEFAADCILFQHLRSAPKRAALLQRHATLLELFWIFHGFPAKAGMMYISKLHEFNFKDIFKKREAP